MREARSQSPVGVIRLTYRPVRARFAMPPKKRKRVILSRRNRNEHDDRGRRAAHPKGLRLSARRPLVRLQHSLSSPGLTSRSSIPETAVIEPRGCVVLDSPPARGMTMALGGRRRCLILRLVPGTQRSALAVYCRAGAHVSAFYSPHSTVSLSGSRLCAATLARCSASGTRERDTNFSHVTPRRH